jgi:hypothetical protein
VAALAALVAGACGRRGGEEAPRPVPARHAEEIEQPARPDRAKEAGGAAQPEVVFRPRGKAEARVAVEVVRTPRQTRRGLMYRTHLPPDAGMLFLFGRPEVRTFWMRNTLIPLDMIFVTSDMVVAGVIENAEPKTTTMQALPGVLSQYVVEVNGGWARVHGVEAGVPVEFVRVPPLAPGEADQE